MKLLTLGTTLLCLASLTYLTPATHASATPTPCRSEVGGYCANALEFAQAAQAPASKRIPGLEILGEVGDNPGQLLINLYVFGVGIIALSAFLVFTAGAVKYITSGDKDPTRARDMMKNAIIGLAVALISWLGLYVINPDLVRGLRLDIPILRGADDNALELSKTS